MQHDLNKWADTTKTLSVCMIVKDEEENISRCLESVKKIADEIIVVDTGSKDRTVEIAKRFGAKTSSFGWVDDFSAAKNAAIEKTTSDWVLVLDADEFLSPGDAIKLKGLIQKKTPLVGFTLDQRSYVMNKAPKSVKNDSEDPQVSMYPAYVSHNIVRLFKNGEEVKFKNRVHELVEHSIREMKKSFAASGIPIHHLGSLKESNFIDKKADNYIKLIMKQLADDPKNVRYLHQAGRAHMATKEYGKAIEFYTKAADIDPRYKMLFSEIANAYLLKNDPANAADYFRRSLEQNPDHPAPANNLAVLYMKIKRVDLAKKVLEYALRKNPKSVALRKNYDAVLKGET